MGGLNPFSKPKAPAVVQLPPPTPIKLPDPPPPLVIEAPKIELPQVNVPSYSPPPGIDLEAEKTISAPPVDPNGLQAAKLASQAEEAKVNKDDLRKDLNKKKKKPKATTSVNTNSTGLFIPM